MAKTETESRAAAAPALGAGAALSAMIFASRLPPTLDFIVPRRAGWAAFSAAHAALGRPGFRFAFTVAVALLFLGSAGLWLKRAAGAARRVAWTPSELFARAWPLATAFLLARWSFAVWFELSQRAWFPYGSLDALAPLADFAACSAILFAAGRAGLRLLAAKRPSPAAVLVGWAAGTAVVAAFAASAYGAWGSRPPALVALNAPGGFRRYYVVLTEEEGRPSQAAYDMPVASSGAELDPLESLAEKPGVRRLEVLRALYEERAKLMDPEGLRRALSLGARLGDDLGRSLLLAHLASAPPSAEGRAALDALCDESAVRVGPLGASRLALAYARLGDGARAASWAKRAAEGPRGVPEGLLDLSGGGALSPGRISGKVTGERPERVALYRKDSPAAPYLLDAAALSASAEPDGSGRFAFSGLSAGRYYLALAYPSGERRAELRVSGHRGDVVLDARRTAAEVELAARRP